MRIPLRPLARVISARSNGEDPDFQEAERKALVLRLQQARQRRRAQNRLVLVALVIALAYGAVGMRMASLAFAPEETASGTQQRAPIRMARADIVDRNGVVLATNTVARSVFIEPKRVIDPDGVAEGLARILPKVDAEDIHAALDRGQQNYLVTHRTSPEQRQAILELGQPGISFGRREVRVYPHGTLASHILGATSFNNHSVHAAEIVGSAGLELELNDRLSAPETVDAPLALSIDARAQTAMEEVLAAEMARFTAVGASAILMDAHSGEILAMASLPDYDVNRPPHNTDRMFNRAAQGLYELGSTFKPFQAALAMEAGVATPETLIPTKGPIRWGRFTIDDIHKMPDELPLADVIVRSSNVGTARLAQLTGIEAQQEYWRRLGLLDRSVFELPAARSARPQVPKNWSELSMMTISYGHGLSVTQLHLAAAYAPFANGGSMVMPTLRKGGNPLGERVMSEETSAAVLDMMRRVVEEEEGTANFARVPGYGVAGKTGTADKPAPDGSYFEDKVISSFAGVFPAPNPRYVLVLTLDEPETQVGTLTKRTAGWTAAPASARLIRRLVPILDIRPNEPGPSGTPGALVLTATTTSP